MQINLIGKYIKIASRVKLRTIVIILRCMKDSMGECRNALNYYASNILAVRVRRDPVSL